MSNNVFELADQVIVYHVMSQFSGRRATILASTGPGIMKLSGLAFAFSESYHVYIHGYGSIDLDTGQDLIFPAEFLEYAPPEVKPIVPSTWEEFAQDMWALGYSGLVHTIIKGFDDYDEKM